MDILAEKIGSFRKRERTDHPLSGGKCHEKNAADNHNCHRDGPVRSGLLCRRRTGL